MTVDALAALHARCFSTAPAAWSADAFAATLAGPGAFLLGDAEAFLIGRVVADEAELLTLAVAPERRRQGRAAALCHRFAATAAQAGAAKAFLEVAADNDAARALYARCGWSECGRRRGYYGPGRDAIVMRLALA